MRPIIGITCAWSVETWGDSFDEGGYYYVGAPYAQTISRCGGIPLLIAPEHENHLDEMVTDIINKVDGLIFSGGGDAKRFAPDELPTLEEQQPKRYRFERKLLKEAWKKQMPVIGICRGHQMIAETFGGSLGKATVEGHSQNLPGYKPWHEIKIEKDGKLYKIVNKETWNVNSFHRQVVNKLPEGFSIAAKTSEGIVEGIEANNQDFFIGLQFHPEELAPYDPTAQHIFEEFIKRAKKFQSRL